MVSIFYGAVTVSNILVTVWHFMYCLYDNSFGEACLIKVTMQGPVLCCLWVGVFDGSKVVD